MTVPLWCLMIGVILPYVWAFSSLPFRAKQFGSPDLKEPRVQGEQLTGSGARAWGSQMNAWEAVIVFGAATVAAIVAGVSPEGNWSMASMIWVVARASHGGFYIRGIAPLRILAFTIGMGMSFWIFAMAIMA
ncbi:MAG: MAPEG family protein [Gammaproteobacteria bacterium]|nr:MAPEG family protein [Gammaproteobacteria bacterium]